MKELVNHPKHYNSHPSGVECIDIIEHHNLNIGNAIKYLWRQGLKDGNPAVQDLEKARFYIDREIKRIAPQQTVLDMEKLKAGDMIRLDDGGKIAFIKDIFELTNGNYRVFLDTEIYNNIEQIYIDQGIFDKNGKGVENCDIIDYQALPNP